MSFGTNVMPRRFGQNGKPPYRPGDVYRKRDESLARALGMRTAAAIGIAPHRAKM